MSHFEPVASTITSRGQPLLSRRGWLWGGAVAAGFAAGRFTCAAEPRRARIAITLDLEMSAEYPRPGATEWNFEKGNLDADTKNYALKAAHSAEEFAAKIHFFCVARVLEQPNVDWLRSLASAGHPIGNHTYDHVNVLAKQPEETQFRFRRAPWLVQGLTAEQIVDRNIELASQAMSQRLGIQPNGFRTPGGFARGLTGKEELQTRLNKLGFSWISSQYDSPDLGPPGVEPTEAIYHSIADCQARNQPFVYPTGLIEIPMSPVSDVHAFRTQRWKLDWFLEAIRRGVQWAVESRGVFVFLAHPSCLLVEDPKCEAIRLIGKLATQAGDRAEITTLDLIARSIKA